MDRFSLVWSKEYVSQLFKDYCSDVCEYVLGLMNEKDYGEAEDAAQEAFLRALKYVESSGKELQYPQAWLYKVAKRCYLRSLSKKKKYFEESLDQLLSESEEDTGPIVIPDSIRSQPDILLEDKENVEAITGKLKSLPDGVVRSVMILVAQGDTVEEVSQKVDRSPSSVRVYIARGRDLLKGPEEGE